MAVSEWRYNTQYIQSEHEWWCGGGRASPLPMAETGFTHRTLSERIRLWDFFLWDVPGCRGESGYSGLFSTTVSWALRVFQDDWQLSCSALSGWDWWVFWHIVTPQWRKSCWQDCPRIPHSEHQQIDVSVSTHLSLQWAWHAAINSKKASYPQVNEHQRSLGIRFKNQF